MADAYAGMNRFGDTPNATQYQQAVKENVKRGTREKERAMRDTRGAPEKYSIDERFKSDLQNWIDNTPEDRRIYDGGWFVVGTTSDAMKRIGIRESKIYWRKYKIGTIMQDHPEMDIETLKRVPEIIENPVIVLKSKTQNDSIVAFGDLEAKDGKKVMAAVNLTPIPTGGMDAEFALIASAYGRNDTSVENLLKGSEFLYLDENKKRTDSWLMSLGLQLPSCQPVYGPIGSVSYSDGSVNIRGVKVSLVNNAKKERFSFDDEDYMLAVRAGDMDAAQEMVDEAAQKTGYMIMLLAGE